MPLNLRSFFIVLVNCCTILIKFAWTTLLSLVNLIDGGEEEDHGVPSDNTAWIDYRTAERDPLKRRDGLWFDEW